MQIDLNCDLGEGYPHDAELMALITSANVACGGHAGDDATMRATVQLARRHGVQVGAHPSFPDREHFGRREMERTEDLVRADCLAQIEALSRIAAELQLRLRHVKPHGALYNQACRDLRLAQPVVRAASECKLPVMGLPGSVLEMAARRLGHRFVAEGFADRRYLPDGSLVPRSRPDALIDDPHEAVDQAEQLIRSGRVETICVHGDNPQAVAFVKLLRAELTKRGHIIKAFA